MDRLYAVAFIVLFGLVGWVAHESITLPTKLDKLLVEDTEFQQQVLEDFEAIMNVSGGEIISYTKSNKSYGVKTSDIIYDVMIKDREIYLISFGGQIVYERDKGVIEPE